MRSHPALPTLLLIGATTLAGCGQLGDPHPAPSTVPQTFGVYLNCGGPAAPSQLRDYSYDLDGDGTADHFTAMRCPRTQSDQLEVFSGRSPDDRPQRLGGADAGPLIHRDEHVNLDYSCLMFSGRTVLVGVRDADDEPNVVPVAWIGEWDSARKKVAMRPDTRGFTIPCAAAAPR
ncbi:hypothetical protein [Asanoa sp. NPDC050611]|uniref:hypothetical protein n=1 Tax=Asanoa sp. NPDC050611 TaxID=3157098 RepID=UPI003411E47C